MKTGSREVSGIEVELWVAASGEDWNSGPQLDVGAANSLQEAVELSAAAGDHCLASASY